MKDFYKLLAVSVFALSAVAFCAADEVASSDEHKQQESVTESVVVDSSDAAEVNAEPAK